MSSDHIPAAPVLEQAAAGFAMLNGLRGTGAAEAAITQAVAFLRRALGTD